MRLHHIGYVVANLGKAIPGFVEILGARWNGRIIEDPYQQVRVAFLTTDTVDAQIELIEPAAERSPVSRFLEERGGGLHHCCYEVASLDESISTMRKQGALLTKNPKPAAAFGGQLIAWVLTPDKLLVELLERGKDAE